MAVSLGTLKGTLVIRFDNGATVDLGHIGLPLALQGDAYAGRLTMTADVGSLKDAVQAILSEIGQ